MNRLPLLPFLWMLEQQQFTNHKEKNKNDEILNSADNMQNMFRFKYLKKNEIFN